MRMVSSAKIMARLKQARSETDSAGDAAGNATGRQSRLTRPPNPACIIGRDLLQGSKRAVALPKSVRDDINESRSVSRNTMPDAWVFPSENAKPPLWANNAWYDKIRPTLAKLKLAWVNYQVLRRSAVSLLNADCGADPTIIATQCGHT